MKITSELGFEPQEIAEKIRITEMGEIDLFSLRDLYLNDLIVLPSFQRDLIASGKRQDEVRRGILESFVRDYRIPAIELANLTPEDSPWKLKVEYTEGQTSI